MSKKSAFQTVAEAVVFGTKGQIPTDTVDFRTLTESELKEIIKEEFGKAVEAAAVKAKEVQGGWGDVELEKQVDWVKALDLKEFLNPEKK